MCTQVDCGGRIVCSDSGTIRALHVLHSHPIGFLYGETC